MLPAFNASCVKYASKSFGQIFSSTLILPTVIVRCVNVVVPEGSNEQESVPKTASVSIKGIATTDLALGITIPPSLINCCVFASNTALVKSGLTSCFVYEVNVPKLNAILFYFKFLTK